MVGRLQLYTKMGVIDFCIEKNIESIENTRVINKKGVSIVDTTLIELEVSIWRKQQMRDSKMNQKP